MKYGRAVLAIITAILILLLSVTVPVSFAQGGGRGSMGGAGRAGGGGHPHFHGQGGHHHFHHDHFFFGFGVRTFVPTWRWYDPYYYWGAPPYSPYYGYPYPNYYGYSYYWSDPCLSSDPAYAPYCPPTAGSPPQGGYSVPPVGYPSLAPPIQPESGREPQSTAPPQ